MDLKDEQTLAMEVGHRFDEIFGGLAQPPQPDPTAVSLTQKLMESPLKNLKSIVLALDWEITGPILDRFLEETETTSRDYQSDPVLTQFFKILKVLGQYIQNKGAGAHPEAIKLLHSAYDHLEELALGEGLSETDRKRMLAQDVDAFKRLKQHIQARGQVQPEDTLIPSEPQTVPSATSQTPIPVQEHPRDEEPPPPREEAGPVQEPGAPIAREEEPDRDSGVSLQPYAREMAQMTPHEAFAYALVEIKKTLEAEFSALRAEIRMWRKGQ